MSQSQHEPTPPAAATQEPTTGAPEPPAEPAPTPPADDRLAAIEARFVEQDRARLMGEVLGPVAALPMAQYFAQHYGGELSREAITEAATAINLIGPVALIDPAAVSGFTAALDMSRGGMAPGHEPGPHPNELAVEAAKAARQRGTEGDALAAYIESQARSIHAGDRRQLVDMHSARHVVQDTPLR